MSWVRIDDRREISTDFITCAEYQLFIDEERSSYRYSHPEHWESDQFPKGQAQEPIVGVHGEDASRFCEWLSQRQGNRFKYRLPTLEEISIYQAVAGENIGCWCMAEGKRFVHGYHPAQWKKWQEFLSSAFIHDWDRIFIHDFDRALGRALNFNLDPDLARALDPDLTSALNLDRTIDRNLACTLARVFARDLAHDITHNLACALDCYRIRNFAPGLNFNRLRSLAPGLNFNRVHNVRSTLNDLPDLRSFCCIFIMLWMLKRDIPSNSKLAWLKRLLPRRTKTDFDNKIEQRRKAALKLYTFFFLIDERRKGNLPAWEGIRVVREPSSMATDSISISLPSLSVRAF